MTLLDHYRDCLRKAGVARAQRDFDEARFQLTWARVFRAQIRLAAAVAGIREALQ